MTFEINNLYPTIPADGQPDQIQNLNTLNYPDNNLPQHNQIQLSNIKIKF